MAASYPGTIKTFSTKASGEAIASSHINDIQTEVVALETQLVTSKLATLTTAPAANNVLTTDESGNPTWGGTWAAWTPTEVGWTDGTLTGTFRYSQVGKLVYCIIAITAGTSNDTMATVSLPVQPAASAGVIRGTWGWGQDAGVQVNPAGGYLLNPSNGGTINFFKSSIDGAAWTNSGTKRIYCTFFYEAA